MTAVFDYTKEDRFAVVRKLPRDKRYKSNFFKLYNNRFEAEQEAVRLTEIYRAKFYITEIQRITST